MNIFGFCKVWFLIDLSGSGLVGKCNEGRSGITILKTCVIASTNSVIYDQLKRKSIFLWTQLLKFCGDMLLIVWILFFMIQYNKRRACIMTRHRFEPRPMICDACITYVMTHIMICVNTATDLMHAMSCAWTCIQHQDSVMTRMSCAWTCMSWHELLLVLHSSIQF